MDTIKFSTNWNNKLDNKAFTTIRIHNEHKYKIGSLFAIEINGKAKGTAKIMDIRNLKANQLNDFICYLDTGYNKETTLNILRKMYKNLDFNFVTLDFCLLVYEPKKTELPTVSNRWPLI